MLPEPSRSRKATYKILHYHLPSWVAYHRFIKVDTLTLDTVNLPAILASDTSQINNIPVMPLFDLLRHEDAGYSILLRKDREKVKRDVVEVDALLDCAEEEDVGYEHDRVVYRHTCELMEWALVLARSFVRRHRRQAIRPRIAACPAPLLY